MTALVLWMLLHSALAALATGLARRYALRRQLLDQPGERRSHLLPTPRGGGVAIVATVLLGLAWLLLQWPQQQEFLAYFAVGLVLVAGIGWWDDHRPLSPWLRLAIHALAALVLAWAVYRATAAMLPAGLAFVAVMALVNVWNFMDGIDGLSASQAAICSAGLALVIGTGPWAWLAAGLFAAICGFLPFNFPKAKIFLGDVGSGALGYLLAGLLVAAYLSARVPWPLLLLPVCAFLIDAGFTLGMRILRGERWWQPHVEHAYQRWAHKRGAHILVTSAYAVFSLLAVILMLSALRLPPAVMLPVCLSWYGFAAALWARKRRDIQLSRETDR